MDEPPSTIVGAVRLVASFAVALVLAASAASAALAALPSAGLVVPGQRLDGVKLGATPAQVRKAWGRDFGKCGICDLPTWYFNYTDFQPQGLGVTFRRGHVVALFTLWAPAGWHTPNGLEVGDEAPAVTDLYGGLPLVSCGAYQAYALRGRRATTAIYVQEGKIWAFAVSLKGVPLCR
jgi:hypothetical protein